MNEFQVQAVQTDLFHPGQDLFPFLKRKLEPLRNQDSLVLAITSKIFSLAENCLVSKTEITKRELVIRESDTYLGEIGYGCHLTIKHGLLIPSAGIDESNSETGDYILYPTDPFGSLRKLRKRFLIEFGWDHLGLIMTDSHTTPLRRGVTGIALAYSGIRGVRNMVGKPDLFGRPLQMTQINVVDALAAAAVFAMGEANERCPLAVIQGADVEFVTENDPSEVQIPMSEDLYEPLLGKRLR